MRQKSYLKSDTLGSNNWTLGRRYQDINPTDWGDLWSQRSANRTGSKNPIGAFVPVRDHGGATAYRDRICESRNHNSHDKDQVCLTFIRHMMKLSEVTRQVVH